MTIEWQTNAQTLGSTMLYVILWLSLWGIIEHLVDLCVKTEKRRIVAYISLFLITFFVIMLTGQSLTPH